MTLDLHDAPEPCESIIGSMSGNAPAEVKERRREYIRAALAEGHTAEAVAKKLQISKDVVQQIARQISFSEREQILPSTVSSNGGLDPVSQASRMRALWCDVLSAVLHDYNADYWRQARREGGRPEVTLMDLSAYLTSTNGQLVQALAGVTVPRHLAASLIKLPRKEFRARFVKDSRVGECGDEVAE